MHFNLMFNNFNIMFYSQQYEIRNLHMGTYRNCSMLFPSSFKLAWLCCSCMHHHLPCVASCSFVMHHTWLCIMPCSCVVCLPCCVLLLASSRFVAIVRIRSSTLGSSSWIHLLHGTHSSSLRDFRQDDRHLGSHYYHCYASCFVLSLCCVTYLLLIKPSQIAMNL